MIFGKKKSVLLRKFTKSASFVQMVSDQYHVNDRAMSDEVMSENGKKVRDIKASISSPIPTEDVANVLEYFGITTATVPNEHMENKYRMQAHARLVRMKKC